MINRISNLNEYLIKLGRELYDSSVQEQMELPIILSHVKNHQLKNLISKQLRIGKNQFLRLQQIFNDLNESPKGEKNKCCHSIFKQTKVMIDRSKNSAVSDAVIINLIQQLNHSKIVRLGSVMSYALEIDHEQIAESLYQSLNEEKAIDQELTNLAEDKINKKGISMMAY
jgi:ferritin-like metal-binding protein YciE